MPDVTPSTIRAPDGTPLAYHATPSRRPGDGRAGIVFLGGFRSDMQGQKALALEARARADGLAFLRLDYSGHGQSGGRFVDGTIGRWSEDALTIIRHAGATVPGLGGKLVLCGSSMGGWIMLLAALALAREAGAQHAAGLVGIAAAPDFTADLLPAQLGPEGMETIRRDGRLDLPSAYSEEPTTITSALVEDGDRNLVLRAPIPLACPARLIHGTADPDVPWQVSARLLDRLASTDATLTLVKDGDHRLSTPRDLARLCDTAVELAG